MLGSRASIEKPIREHGYMHMEPVILHVDPVATVSASPGVSITHPNTRNNVS